jgi:RNA polymerase sigma-B factor
MPDLIQRRPSDQHDLSREERSAQTRELFEAIAAETDAGRIQELRERVILINSRVAAAVASRYVQRGVPAEDLCQVAYEGLVKAAHRFDPALRNDFLTFAVPTIRGELQRHFRDRSWTIRTPRRVQETQWRASQAIARLEIELGREPRADEVAAAIGVSQKEYDDAMAATGCFEPTSLDAPTSSASGTVGIGDLLPDASAEHRFRAAEATAVLRPVLRRLSERDRRILYLRFFEDRTQQEIGEDIGVTQMQVSRLLSAILESLRDELDGAA